MRRANGDGSVYQLRNGRWVAALSIGMGKRKTWERDTRQAAQRELAKARRQFEDGLALSDDTVGKFLNRWLDGKTRIGDSTKREYRRYVDTYTKSIHKIPLNTLSPAHLQSLYAAQTCGPATVDKLRKMLLQAFNQAELWGLVRRNVARLVETPKPARYEAHPLDEEQVVRLVEVVRGSRLEALWLLWLNTGLREGELFALHWDDLQDGSLVVRHTLHRPQGGGYVIKENKNSGSRRLVPLPGEMLEVLKVHRARQLEERLAAYEWADENLMFTNSVGKALNPANVIGRVWKPLLETAGIPYVRPYDLRHTAATLLLTKGVNPKLVAEMLGHSSIVVTMDKYSHVTPSMRAQATAELAKILFARPAARLDIPNPSV